MKILYDSEEIATCIKSLFEKASRSDRRVVLVAYVGKDYATFLPNPQGINVVCNPTPGATSSIAVSGLQKSGANVQFSDRLHMKVYWSETHGCVITSANLSKNALGVRGLKEAGVFAEPNIVEIDALLKSARPYEVTKNRLRELKKKEDEIEEALALVGRRWSDRSTSSYSDWCRLESSSRHVWKLGWWIETGQYARAAKDWTKLKHARSEPHDFINVSKGQASAKDWFLNFRITPTGVKSIGWMYVNHVVPIEKSEPAYGKEYPFQAFQALPLSRCPEPPFQITASFRNSFGKAVEKYGRSKIVDDPDLVPKAALLKYINQFEREQQAA